MVRRTGISVPAQAAAAERRRLLVSVRLCIAVSKATEVEDPGDHHENQRIANHSHSMPNSSLRLKWRTAAGRELLDASGARREAAMLSL